MNEKDLFDLLANLGRARGQGARADSEAPHKPLLLLVLLARLDEGAANRFPYSEIEQPFRALWQKYGWTNPTRAAYPFWYLTNDGGLWELQASREVVETAGRAPPAKSALVGNRTTGAFRPDAIALLGRRAVRRRAIDLIIERYFRESVRDELRQDLGLSWEPDTAAERCEAPPSGVRRSPAEQSRFRDELMLAYEKRCAVCGFGPRDARPPSGVEAAHLWPWEQGGPTVAENGLALCPIHHWALDAGVLAFTDELHILVSAKVTDGEMLQRYVRSYSGKRLRRPLPGFALPAPRYVRMQRERLFLGRPISRAA